jgi:D-alanyl-D-alanine carboxypeptidase
VDAIAVKIASMSQMMDLYLVMQRQEDEEDRKEGAI